MSSGFGQELDAVSLARARRGDRAVLEALYARYSRACYTLAMRVLGERAAAEDVVQDVFVRVLSTIRDFRADAPFGAWLKRMTANATIDVLRRNRRFTDEDFESVLATMTDGGGGESAADAWLLLRRLPARARAVLVLHELEGYTHRELAQMFGQSESYSKSILARALKRLDGMMNEAGDRAETNDAV
ncbi:MAG: sigma-70 family RNA polymerase sigma factor [Xanthomonadales bacterium]|nr:sigma-70 family RNA polymerase sigma factor [Xanthomonadales bacterium]